MFNVFVVLFFLLICFLLFFFFFSWNTDQPDAMGLRGLFGLEPFAEDPEENWDSEEETGAGEGCSSLARWTLLGEVGRGNLLTFETACHAFLRG